MALYFASSDDYAERPKPRDRVAAPSSQGNVTTLGKTDKFKPAQYPAAQKEAKGRSPMRFDQATGYKAEYGFGDALRDTGSALAKMPDVVSRYDPLGEMHRGITERTQALAPELYQAVRHPSLFSATGAINQLDPLAGMTGGEFYIGGGAARRSVEQFQQRNPEIARTMGALMEAGMAGGGAHAYEAHSTPHMMARQFAERNTMVPEPMPRPPGLQTPMRDILSRASQPGAEAYMATPQQIGAQT